MNTAAVSVPMGDSPVPLVPRPDDHGAGETREDVSSTNVPSSVIEPGEKEPSASVNADLANFESVAGNNTSVTQEDGDDPPIMAKEAAQKEFERWRDYLIANYQNMSSEEVKYLYDLAEGWRKLAEDLEENEKGNVLPKK